MSEPTLRYSRIFRAFILVSYSKDLRRNLLGILRSLKQLLILFLFYFTIIGIWAYVGSNLFTTQPAIDESMTDYTDFFKLFNMLFIVSTMDFIPDV